MSGISLFRNPGLMRPSTHRASWDRRQNPGHPATFPHLPLSFDSIMAIVASASQTAVVTHRMSISGIGLDGYGFCLNDGRMAVNKLP